jgi:hypothetical protein
MGADAMSFRQKSIVIQIASILLVYGFFGARAWGYWNRPASGLVSVVLLVSVTICMILISIVGHIVISIRTKLEKPDERDQIVSLRGFRNAYQAVAIGVWCTLFLAIVNVPHGLVFFVLMGMFAVSELVRLGSELFYYRLGT